MLNNEVVDFKGLRNVAPLPVANWWIGPGVPGVSGYPVDAGEYSIIPATALYDSDRELLRDVDGEILEETP